MHLTWIYVTVVYIIAYKNEFPAGKEQKSRGQWRYAAPENIVPVRDMRPLSLGEMMPRFEISRSFGYRFRVPNDEIQRQLNGLARLQGGPAHGGL